MWTIADTYISQGTIPYMSINVLRGRDHTYLDDLESFLYVLVLFFFSYKGPLSKAELAAAHRRHFTHPIGSGQLPHVTAWPSMFNYWETTDFQLAAAQKSGQLVDVTRWLHFISYTRHDIGARWVDPESGYRLPISILKLIVECWQIFDERRKEPVTHRGFIDVLGSWLETYKDDEARWSNCPFDEVCPWSMISYASTDYPIARRTL